MPWHVMACEKKGKGGGAFCVLTACFIGFPRMVVELACDGSVEIRDDDAGPETAVDS